MWIGLSGLINLNIKKEKIETLLPNVKVFTFKDAQIGDLAIKIELANCREFAKKFLFAWIEDYCCIASNNNVAKLMDILINIGKEYRIDTTVVFDSYSFEEIILGLRYASRYIDGAVTIGNYFDIRNQIQAEIFEYIWKESVKSGKWNRNPNFWKTNCSINQYLIYETNRYLQLIDEEKKN
jgi:hypothetical protein